MKAIKGLAKQAGPFDRMSVGARDRPFWCHQRRRELGRGMGPFSPTKTLGSMFGKPVRAANDADMQGFGAISGTGVELVLTLGTGVGSSMSSTDVRS